MATRSCTRTAVRRNGGVGPIQRHGSEAVAGASRLAGQDVCIEGFDARICRQTATALTLKATFVPLSDDQMTGVEPGTCQPVKVRSFARSGRIIPKTKWRVAEVH